MQINGLNVFPLVKADSLLQGYFMDADGNVYSNKGLAGGNRLSKLGGSRTQSGRYYTLNGRSFRADRLVTSAKQCPSFVIETAGTTVTPVIVSAPVAAWPMIGGQGPATANNQPLPAGRTRSAKQAAKDKGFVLAHIGPTDRLVFGTEPVLHLARSTAVEEAERVANLKPGTKILVLQIVGSVTAGGTQWE
jgi:hypothetical protein